MSHHKRKGPKSTRSGCLLCKPHKRQGVDTPKQQELAARLDEKEQTLYYSCGCSRCWGYWDHDFWDEVDASDDVYHDKDYYHFPQYWPHVRTAWKDDEVLSAPLFEAAA